jgi:hypothetical protein
VVQVSADAAATVASIGIVNGDSLTVREKAALAAPEPAASAPPPAAHSNGVDRESNDAAMVRLKAAAPSAVLAVPVLAASSLSTSLLLVDRCSSSLSTPAAASSTPVPTSFQPDVGFTVS